jgi:hypothetical protein
MPSSHQFTSQGRGTDGSTSTVTLAKDGKTITVREHSKDRKGTERRPDDGLRAAVKAKPDLCYPCRCVSLARTGLAPDQLRDYATFRGSGQQNQNRRKYSLGFFPAAGQPFALKKQVS